MLANCKLNYKHKIYFTTNDELIQHFSFRSDAVGGSTGKFFLPFPGLELASCQRANRLTFTAETALNFAILAHA